LRFLTSFFAYFNHTALMIHHLYFFTPLLSNFQTYSNSKRLPTSMLLLRIQNISHFEIFSNILLGIKPDFSNLPVLIESLNLYNIRYISKLPGSMLLSGNRLPGEYALPRDLESLEENTSKESNYPVEHTPRESLKAWKF